MKLQKLNCPNCGFLFISVAVLFVLATSVVFVNDHIASEHNKKMLEEQGYINLVSAGGYELNTRVYGNSENPEYVIVGISGLGCVDTSVTFSNCLEGISENNLIILIDRAGYSFSNVEEVREYIMIYKKIAVIYAY